MSRGFGGGCARAIALLLVLVGFTEVSTAQDAASDSVGATVGQFDVDHSGNATYSIPIYAPPGTAGVSPKLSIIYNSGGATGTMGRGFSISGFSSITRCRKTREAGDFFDGGGNPVDGNSSPVSYTNADVFCLDGQRMLLKANTYGANGAEYRLELDPFTKIKSYGGDNGTSSYTGPTYFVVQRKDGSTSTYGNTPDSRITGLCSGNAVPRSCQSLINVIWAINRFEDSTGNYIDYAYKAPDYSYLAPAAQFLPLSVTYTGRRQLSGQSTAASAPYAGIYFNYIFKVPGATPPQDATLGWQGGTAFAQDQELTSIEVKDQIDSSPRRLRYYKLAYENSASGSNVRVLRSVTECRDDPAAVPTTACYRPTAFTWSDQQGVTHAFATADTFTTIGETRNLVSSRVGDIDGDGRQDLVWFRGSDTLCPSANRLMVSFADRQEAGGISKLVLSNPSQATFCTTLNASSGELDTAWGLVDFDGDGLDDLIIADNNDGTPNPRWHVYRSLGRPTTSNGPIFDTSTDLINVTISTANDSQEQAQLGDFNGDGMVDMLYPTGNNSLAVRFLQRKSDGTGFEFSDALTLDLQFNAGACGGTCNINIFNQGVAAFGVASDLNGDGRADLVIRATPLTSITAPLPDRTFLTAPQLAALPPDAVTVGTPQFFAFVMDSKTGTTQVAKQYGGVLYSYTGGTGPTDARQFQFADFNGDGLPDLFYQQDLSSDDFVYAINRGDGFESSGIVYAFSGQVYDIPNRDKLKLVDVNGDGRADIVFPSSDSHPCPGSTGAQRVFRYRSFTYATSPNGSFGVVGSSSDTDATCIAGNTVVGDDPTQWDYFFADFDGDGELDFLKLRDGGSTPTLYTSRASSGMRYKPRDVVTNIANGYGATTTISYQPLTNKAIYRRAQYSRRDKLFGRNSPVLDILSPTYVVSQVSSSAPTVSSSGATSSVWYRYEGARIQGGGRGFLGFASIVTFDANPVSNSYVGTYNAYRQDFPFVGAPLYTEKWLLSGSVATRGSTELNSCAGNPEATGLNCFYNPADAATLAHPNFGTDANSNTIDLGGVRVVYTGSGWECQGNGDGSVCPAPYNGAQCPPATRPAGRRPTTSATALVPTGSQQAIFTYTFTTDDVLFDAVTGAVNSDVFGVFCYEDGYGNNTHSEMAYTNGPSGTETARKETTNYYVNDSVNWRLGRLITSQVDDLRNGVKKSRFSDFDYDVDRSGIYVSTTDTGLLKSQRVQKSLAADQDLRTIYDLDDYGNRTAAYTCGTLDPVDGSVLTDTECKTKSRVQHRPVGSSGPTSAVHRYTLTQFDTRLPLASRRGRYADKTLVPFYSVSGTNNVNEQASATVNARDEFGNATSTTTATGLTMTAQYGYLGRPYTVSDSTGKSATTTYAWCGAGAGEANCPTGAVFRQKIVTAGMPTQWSYFDKLGRESLKVAQSFNDGVSGKNFSATCIGFDAHGRPAYNSAPFFLGSIAGVGTDPAFASANPCWNGSTSPAGATLTYDGLGRTTQTKAPDGSITSTTYAGLSTTVTDSRNQQTKETKNVVGEIISITQADPTSGTASGLVVTQEYDEQGNLRFIRRNAGAGEIVTEIQYDALGRKTKVIDPDKGTLDYVYNAAGEVIRTTDPRNLRIEQDVDALGRTWRRRSGSIEALSAAADLLFRDGFEDAGTPFGEVTKDDWQFDTATNGLGNLAFERRTIGTLPTAFFRQHFYDSVGRLSQSQTIFDSVTYNQYQSYDGFGRLQTETDASSGVSSRFYTARGYLSYVQYSLADVGNAGKFYEVLEQDAWGHVISERRNGSLSPISTVSSYDQLRGWIDLVTTTNGSGTHLQDWDFDFDTNGNLKRRNRGNGALTEDLTYDKLNRLTQVVLSGSATTSLTTTASYDALGNICSKGPVGATVSYTYAGRAGCAGALGDSTKSPHAVSQYGTISYLYDPVGNQTLGNSSSNNADDHTVAYDAFSQAIFMTRGDVMAVTPTYDTQFFYGPHLGRYRRLDSNNGSPIKTTRYIGNVEVIITNNGATTETKRYLAGGTIVTTSNQNSTVVDRYTLPDHLGSPDVVVADNGTIVESTSFDAWGLRRGASNWQGSGTALATSTRGFTGHEHAESIGLIHMNGRIYDPVIGRFVQADPLNDSGTQGLNRYSYVLNNPLSSTDPSGCLTTHQWGQIFMAVVLAAGTGGVGTQAMSAGEAYVFVGANGFMAGAVQSGTLKGGAWGAFSSLAFYAVGSYFDSAQWAHNGEHVFGTDLNMGGFAAKVLAHGTLGGVVQHLQGGKYGSGFAAAGATQAFSGAIDNIDPSNPGVSAARVLAAAAVGGTVSSIGGGSFANGAITAAFARTFNDERELEHYAKGTGLSVKQFKEAIGAAKFALKKAETLSDKSTLEYGGAVYLSEDNKIVASGLVEGHEHDVKPLMAYIPETARILFAFHWHHGPNNDAFSVEDAIVINRWGNNIPGFVGGILGARDGATGTSRAWLYMPGWMGDPEHQWSYDDMRRDQYDLGRIRK